MSDMNMRQLLKQGTLFGDGDIEIPMSEPNDPDAEYKAFVNKFKPKKTTDDCYTPTAVYEAVRDWVNRDLMLLDGVEIVRPFWPGGDYKTQHYPAGCLVLDNPPFSILAEIRRWYSARGIRYFLFAPGLTLFSSSDMKDECFIVGAAEITYENGAVVRTGFVTNVPTGQRIWVSGALHKAIDDAQKKAKALNPKKALPKYKHPPEMVTAATLQKLAIAGCELKVSPSECMGVKNIDALSAMGKKIYGSGFLLSAAAAERAAAAAERAAAAAERAAAERAAIVLELSERERELIKQLNDI